MQEDAPSAVCRFGNVRGLAAALAAIKTGSRVACVVQFDQSGMTVRWEELSRTMQSGIYLAASLFAQYTVPRKVTLTLPFNSLLDTLSVFASSAPSELEMRYPGQQGEFALETTEDGDGPTSLCNYARIQPLMPQPLADLQDEWEDPVSHFILPGPLLKEAVDDLEWAGGEVEVIMRRDPPRLALFSSRQQSLEIDFPLDQLSSFQVARKEVRWAYKYKHLRAALTNIPQKEPSNVVTKVSIDRGGLIKVTHMLNLQVAPHEPVEVSNPIASFMESQRAPGMAQRVGVVQFLFRAHDDLDQDAGDEREDG